MKRHWIYGIAAILLVVFGASCVGTSASPQKVVRCRGHFTLGAAKSTFMPDGADKTYIVLADDRPESLYQALISQPAHRDITSESDESVSIYADVEGYTIPDSGGALRFHAVKVFSMGPAKHSYIESLAKWPPPVHFTPKI